MVTAEEVKPYNLGWKISALTDMGDELPLDVAIKANLCFADPASAEEFRRGCDDFDSYINDLSATTSR